MMFTQFCIWWYGRGWRGLAASLPRRINKTAETFSVHMLTRTLFSPWRRIISHPGASMGDHFNAMLDNMVSRIVGFLVRLGVLLAAGITLTCIAVLTGLEILLWPCVPLAIIGAIIAGVLA